MKHGDGSAVSLISETREPSEAAEKVILKRRLC